MINPRFRVLRRVPITPFTWQVPDSAYVRLDHDSVQPARLEEQVHQRYDADLMKALLKAFDHRVFREAAWRNK